MEVDLFSLSRVKPYNQSWQQDFFAGVKKILLWRLSVPVVPIGAAGEKFSKFENFYAF